MNELRARLLVRRCDKLSESTVDGNKQPVPLVETKTVKQHAVGPLSHPLLCQPDEPIEAIATCFTNAIIDKLLQSG
jgi:hypothetical protein